MVRRFCGEGGKSVAEKKRYSAAGFAKAVEHYFRSISTYEDTGVNDLDGEPIRRVVYITPPCLEGLFLELGITAEEFEQYRAGAPLQPALSPTQRERFRKTAEYAYDRICAWLAQELMTRNKGSLAGLQQKLEQYCLWRNTNSVQKNEKEPQPAVVDVMSLAERERVLQEIALAFSADCTEQTNQEAEHAS